MRTRLFAPLVLLGLACSPGLARAQPSEHLEEALATYASVAPSDPAYTDALEQIAWLTFLLDRTSEAVTRYVALLDRLEAAHDAGPRRGEALRMLAAMLADVDWDHDGAPDAATPGARLADPALVPQDRSWLAELTFETAHALYLSSRDPEAIALLDAALSRWPAPAHGTPIVAACRRHRVRPESLRGTDAQVLASTSAACARHAP